MDQVVEHVMGPDVSLLVLERLAVIEHHQARRLRLVVLGRHVNPVGVGGARIHLARQRERPDDLAVRHAFLLERIGAELVERIGPLGEDIAAQQHDRTCHDNAFHDRFLTHLLD
ncbi:MAG TPA: hypothetical protein VFE62_17045 [Gemmataceae bacterium]|nr:hypothetical protein [Gemmataceae bacterium]